MKFMFHEVVKKPKKKYKVNSVTGAFKDFP